jgi:hypothetical protein
MAEIYVINNAGNILFYYSRTSQASITQSSHDEQHQLVASFLTSILQFAKALHNDEISNFEMGSRRVVIIPSINSTVYYVTISEKTEKKKTKELETELLRVRKLFEEKFGTNAITTWDGNTETFMSFKNVLERNMANNVDDYFSSF